MRLHVEYQRFFTELSERPGRDLAISAQRVPRAACIWRMMASSSGVHAPFLSVGSRLLHQRSRHCLPVRPGSMEAMRAHCLPPKRLTSSVSWASSVADLNARRCACDASSAEGRLRGHARRRHSTHHGPLTQSGCVSFCQRWMHCTSLRPSNALATSAQLEMACSFPCSFSHEVLSPCAFGEAGSDVSPMLSRSIPERAGGRHAASRLRRSSSDRFQAVATLTLDGAITPPDAQSARRTTIIPTACWRETTGLGAWPCVRLRHGRGAKRETDVPVRGGLCSSPWASAVWTAELPGITLAEAGAESGRRALRVAGCERQRRGAPCLQVVQDGSSVLVLLHEYDGGVREHVHGQVLCAARASSGGGRRGDG
eukprot:scaffold266757_cov32-Tisochrysis_lutea.AAC.3